MKSKNKDDLQLLYQLLSTATHDASAAMSRWTNGMITMELDDLHETSLEDAASQYELTPDLLTMVVLTLEGENGGTMILAFDEKNGRQLASTLLRKPLSSVGSEWSPLEQSALCETGNILGCAYLNSITRLIGAELVPSPPFFLQDYGSSVFEQAIMEQADDSDKILVCKTIFHLDSVELDWSVLFLPTSGLRHAMESSVLATS